MSDLGNAGLGVLYGLISANEQQYQQTQKTLKQMELEQWRMQQSDAMQRSLEEWRLGRQRDAAALVRQDELAFRLEHAEDVGGAAGQEEVARQKAILGDDDLQSSIRENTRQNTLASNATSIEVYMANLEDPAYQAAQTRAKQIEVERDILVKMNTLPSLTRLELAEVAADYLKNNEAFGYLMLGLDQVNLNDTKAVAAASKVFNVDLAQVLQSRKPVYPPEAVLERLDAYTLSMTQQSTARVINEFADDYNARGILDKWTQDGSGKNQPPLASLARELINFNSSIKPEDKARAYDGIMTAISTIAKQDESAALKNDARALLTWIDKAKEEGTNLTLLRSFEGNTQPLPSSDDALKHWNTWKGLPEEKRAGSFALYDLGNMQRTQAMEINEVRQRKGKLGTPPTRTPPVGGTMGPPSPEQSGQQVPQQAGILGPPPPEPQPQVNQGPMGPPQPAQAQAPVVAPAQAPAPAPQPQGPTGQQQGILSWADSMMQTSMQALQQQVEQSRAQTQALLDSVTQPAQVNTDAIASPETMLPDIPQSTVPTVSVSRPQPTVPAISTEEMADIDRQAALLGEAPTSAPQPTVPQLRSDGTAPIKLPVGGPDVKQQLVGAMVNQILTNPDIKTRTDKEIKQTFMRLVQVYIDNGALEGNELSIMKELWPSIEKQLIEARKGE